MPHQFLFIAEIPPSRSLSSAPGYPYEWTQFERAASTTLKPLKACTRLQQNAWLLPAENAWPYLKELSSTAETNNLAYSISLVVGDVVLITNKP